MNERDEREERWMAYYLDELPPEDRVEVEAELRASPDAAEEYRRFVEGVSTWAREPALEAPLTLDAVRAAAEPARCAAPATRRRLLPRLAWLAAAALVLGVGAGALWRGISVSVGDTTVRLGNETSSRHDDALMTEVSNLRQELAVFQAELASCRGELQQVSRQNAALESQFRVTTAQLARNQQIETQTRYRDVRQVLRLAGLVQPEDNEWPEQPSHGIHKGKEE